MNVLNEVRFFIQFFQRFILVKFELFKFLNRNISNAESSVKGQYFDHHTK